MGIYSSDIIFGIRIYNFNDDFSNTLFEEKYDEIINREQMKKAYLFYNELNNKNEIYFQYYIECSNTYSKDVFKMWYPISLNLFLEEFDV